LDRNRAPQSEQSQIERQDGPHQHNEAEYVQDLDRGIKRGRAAHHMTQRAFLQGLIGKELRFAPFSPGVWSLAYNRKRFPDRFAETEIAP
jgi:hypothetical protein